ncbi:GntR family transcriptional regulator [Paratissierella segnis]|mgnify:FL=1|jgi:GntR family transcriptional regulator|uniref:GntR family transcriptional regulator n=1 Tax=Paratissierella segnis TaxID=2763679 RepID=A0A926EXU7_9FIRM|nr:GntR family transcriptional regulator [Paratissierella segnis]MBC8588235.1 GntR family transcriptional regulator [Paratissierella segnis]
MLDREGVTPLYIQLMNLLEDNIRKGNLVPGERLLTEVEMAREYDVSIVTVRNAIGELIDKGLVERQQGKGTFVTKPKLTKDIRKLQSFTEMCFRMGVRPGGKMLENKLVISNEKIAKQLRIERNDHVVYISRVRYADGDPVVIEKNYFPLEYAFLLGEKFDNNSLFEFIKDKNKTEVAISEKRIEICRATAEEAEILNIRKGDSLLYIKSVAYTRDNEPIYAGTQIINGERFSLYVYEATGV